MAKPLVSDELWALIEPLTTNVVGLVESLGHEMRPQSSLRTREAVGSRLLALDGSLVAELPLGALRAVSTIPRTIESDRLGSSVDGNERGFADELRVLKARGRRPSRRTAYLGDEAPQ